MKLFGYTDVPPIGASGRRRQLYIEIPWMKSREEKEEARRTCVHHILVTLALFFLFIVSVASLWWIPLFNQLKPLQVGAMITHNLRAKFDFDVTDELKLEHDREKFYAEYPIILQKTSAKKEQIENAYLLFLKELCRRFDRERKGETYNIPENDPNAQLMEKVKNLPKELCHYFSYASDIEIAPDSYKIRDFKSKLSRHFTFAQRAELLKEYKQVKEFQPVDVDGAMFEVRDLSELLTPGDAAEKLLDDLKPDLELTNENRKYATDLFTLFFAGGNLEEYNSKREELSSAAWAERYEGSKSEYIKHYKQDDLIFTAGTTMDNESLKIYDSYSRMLYQRNNPWYDLTGNAEPEEALSDSHSMEGNAENSGHTLLVPEQTPETNSEKPVSNESATAKGLSVSDNNTEETGNTNFSFLNKLQTKKIFHGLKKLFLGLYPKIFQVLVILIFCSIYLRAVHSELTKNVSSVWMVSSIVSLTLFIISFSEKLWYSLPYQYALQVDDYLLLPLALPALILTAIYGGRVALFSGLYVSAITAVALGQNQFETILLGLLVSGVAAMSVRNISDGGNFIVHGFMAGFVPSIFALFFFKDAKGLKEILEYISTNGVVLQQSFADGIAESEALQASDYLTVIAVSLLTPVIAFLILTFLDKFNVRIATNLTYLSLIDPSNKLLTQLRLKAPGTYYHSLNVSSLAAAAANKIGAKDLKVQTYAMYHDIGKLEEPAMFTENDPEHESHTGLTPSESAKIIRRHVEIGVRLGKAEHLKTHILRAIAQHHGDDCISYFYRKEKEMTGREPPKDPFFYAGPRPTEVESTILMLADCSEAASHSLKNPTEEDIRNKISEIFTQKYKNHQLDESKITLRELAEIRESFVSAIMAMGHTRVSYSIADTTSKIPVSPATDSADKKPVGN